MLFLEEFGFRLSVVFGTLALIGAIIGYVKGYMPFMVSVYASISFIGCIIYSTASKIQRDKKKAFKEMLDKLIEDDEVEENDKDN